MVSNNPSIRMTTPDIEHVGIIAPKKGRELKGKLAILAARVGIVALAILLSPVILVLAVLAGAYTGYKRLSDYHKCTHQKDHLVTANRNMKKSEERTKLKAAAEFYRRELKELTQGTEFVAFMSDHIQGKLQNSDLVENYETRCKKCSLTPSARVISSLNELKTTAKEEANEFKTKFSAFVNALSVEIPEGNSEKVAEANQKIIEAFRDVLRSRAYQALKYDSADPAITFLHRFAASIWTEVKVLDAYQEFGEKALQEKSPPASGLASKEKTVNEALEESLISAAEGKPKTITDALEISLKTSAARKQKMVMEAIELSIKNVSRDLFQVRRLPDLILYSVTHPLHTLNSMMSEGGKARFVAEVAGREDYDPHGKLSNNPSLQGTTVVKMEIGKKENEVKINNVYGGSPTIGDDEIAPEFLAVLQAAENNQLGGSNRIKGIPDQVFYTNFQNLGKKHGENPRSVAIMKLNAQYPLSFLGITLSKDSDFYLMPKSKSDQNKPFDLKSYPEEMLRHLLDDSSFSLEERASKKENDKGFYFPRKKEDWEPLFKMVVEQAKATFEKVDIKGAGSYELKGAFQELVYASLQHLIELKLTKELIEKGMTHPSLHSQRACKENIDRGAAANAAYLHLRLGIEKSMSQEVKNQLVTGALHCRALGARDRMILPDRLPQVLAFMRTITPEQFWEAQKQLEEKIELKTTSTTFQPGLHSPVLAAA